MEGTAVALAVFAAAPVVTGVAAFRTIRRGRAANKPTRARYVAGNALVLLFLLSLLALGGEIYFRWVRDSTDALGYLRATDRWFAKHYQLNRDTFRDDVEYVIGPVPAGKRRISFVGDSFTAGHGVEVHERFANLVRAAHPEWEVHVLAKNGADTGAELALLRDRIPAYRGGAYEFDIVVLVYCPNDIGDIVPHVGDLARRLAERDQRGVFARNSDLFDWLRLVRVCATDPEVRDFFPSIAKGYEDAATWQRQCERLRAMRKAVTDRGGEFAAVTFPFVGTLGGRYPFRNAHRLLEAHFTPETAYLDLSLAFWPYDGEDLVVGRYDGHPNALAHRRAAEAIGPFVERLAAACK